MNLWKIGQMLALAAGVATAPAWAQREMVTLDGPPRERGFEGIFTLGINGAQIDGDGLGGFHLPGLYVGLAARYRITEELYIGPEFIYTQKGSRTTLDDEGIRFITHQLTRLHYAELPLLIYYRPATVRRFTLQAGPAVSYLFSGRGEYGDLSGDVTDRWTRIDVSAMAGFEYNFTEWLSGMARWTYSLKPNNAGYVDPNFYQIAVQGAGWRNNTITVGLRLNFSRLKDR